MMTILLRTHTFHSRDVSIYDEEEQRKRERERERERTQLYKEITYHNLSIDL